jgi:hypothetical protein
MSPELGATILLIAVPIAFNLAFFELSRAFDYPGILRQPADVILRRFDAGGTGLRLRWQALLVSALGMLPLVALSSIALDAGSGLTITMVVVGSAAAMVQALGIARWPFAAPELARRYVAADGPDAAAARATIETVFVTVHRLFGVGIGEHLGYLLTGIWTILVAFGILSATAVAPWLGWLGLPIGAAMLVGSLEYVGPNERAGWPLAGMIVPIAYVGWSLWLIAVGIGLAV